MTDKEAMKLALKALNKLTDVFLDTQGIYGDYETKAIDQGYEAIDALKEALADHPMREVQRLGQEIEPDDMASILACRDMLDAQPVPPRTWVGLTDDDEIDWEEGGNLKDLVKAIEAKLKQKNGYAEEKNAICSPFMISELWKLHK